MKKSEIGVTITMAYYEELVGYKDKFYELKREVTNFIESTNEEEMPYRFNVNKALNFCKKLSFIPSNANIDVIFEKGMSV